MQLYLGGAALFILGKVLKIHTVFKLIILFNTATADKRLIALADKGGQTHQQRVDKLVLIGMIALLAEHVQNARGGDLVTLDLQNQVRMLSQMLDGLFRDAARQLDGHDLLLLRNSHVGIADDRIQRGYGRLHASDPLGINALTYRARLEGGLGIRGPDEHTCLLKISILLGDLLQGREGLGSE